MAAAYMPATIVIARGLVQPPPRCGRRFPAVRQGVNQFDIDIIGLNKFVWKFAI